MEAAQIEEMNKMRAAAMQQMDDVQKIYRDRLLSFDKAYEMANVAMSAANAAHPEDKPVASLLQLAGEIVVMIIGTGADLKRVHMALRNRGHWVSSRHAAADNSYVYLTYVGKKDQQNGPTLRVNASFPECTRVLVGEELVKQYKVVCGEGADKFQTLEEMEA